MARSSIRIPARFTKSTRPVEAKPITPAVTFPTTLSPILQNRMLPLFVDCEIGSYDVDVDQVAAAVTPRTRALVIPDTAGNPCPLARIMEIVTEHHSGHVRDYRARVGGAVERRGQGAVRVEGKTVKPRLGVFGEERVGRTHHLRFPPAM